MTTLRLSAIDHVMAGPAVASPAFTLHYSRELDAPWLEATFRATCRQFVGSAGRLVQTGPHELAIDLSSDAAEFEVVAADSGGVHSRAIEPVRTGIDACLMRVRVTQRGDAGSSLGVSLSHAVADGYGFCLFLAAWAARSCGREFPEPSCDRSLLSRPDAHARAAGLPSSRQPERARAGFVDTPVSADRHWQESFIPAASVQPPSTGKPLSANDYLSAVLWQRLIDDRHARSSLACAVDIRRYRPELGPMYFGNAVLLAALTVDADELRNTPAVEIAGWIRDAIARVPGRIDAAIEELELIRVARGAGTLALMRGYDPEHGVLISNLSRLPLAALDYGCGRPCRVDLASLPPNGTSCIVLPGPEHQLRLLVAR